MDSDANAKVDANITKANTTDVNTTSAERIHETAAVPTHVLASPPCGPNIPLRPRICEYAADARVLVSVETSCLSINQETKAHPPSL